MFEDVEELRPELSAEPLAEMEVLRHRKIHIFEASVGESIATYRPKTAQWRGDHDCVALLIAAVEGQRFGRSARSSAIDRQRLGVTGGVVRRGGRAVVSGEVRYASRSRFEIVRIAKEIPTDGALRRRTDRQRTDACGIRAFIHRTPMLRTLQCDDGV